MSFKIQSNINSAISPTIGFGNARLARADKFLRLPELTDQYFQKNWFKSANPIKKASAPLVSTVMKAFSSHDYSGIYNVAGLGRIGIAAPLGSVATMVILFTLSARLVYAAKRLKNNDKREIGDILRRDLPTLAMLVYLMDPMTKAFTHFTQKQAGLMLLSKPIPSSANTTWLGKIKQAFVSNAHPLNYSQLENYYKLNNSKRLQEIVNNPLNQNGLKRSLANFSTGKMSSEQARLYGQIKNILTQAINKNTISTKKGINYFGPQLSEKVMGLVDQFEQATIKAGNKINLRNIFVESAKFARHGAAIFSLGSMIFVLGYGITKLNEWWSITQYDKLRKNYSAKPL